MLHHKHYFKHVDILCNIQAIVLKKTSMI